jgi:hypothetical protein
LEQGSYKLEEGKARLWAAMTPEQREYAFQREEQMKAGVEPLLPKAQLADEITKAAEPYMNTIRGLGIDLPQAVAGLMKADHDLRTLPYEQKVALLVTDLARRVRRRSDRAGADRDAARFDPGVQRIQTRTAADEGSGSRPSPSSSRPRGSRGAGRRFNRFAKTAEHFEEVKPTMSKLLQRRHGVRHHGIKDAYEKAIRLHPEIFDQIQSAKQAAADAEKRKAADVAAKAAKSGSGKRQECHTRHREAHQCARQALHAARTIRAV